MSEAVTTDQPDVSSTAPLHEQGLTLARDRRFEQAIGCFQQVLQADPDRMEALRHLAQACADAGRLADSETAWLDYLARREAAPAQPLQPAEGGGQPSSAMTPPTLAETCRHLAEVRKRQDKLDLAIEALMKAIALDRTSPALQVDLGIVFAQGKKFDQAKQAFTRALELQNDYYDALINLGMLLQEMGESKEALPVLRKAVELRPEDPSGLNNLGVVLSELGQFDEAITWYEKLLGESKGATMTGRACLC